MTNLRYKTDGNETLSDVAYRFYGAVEGYIERLYEVNLGVSAQPDVLPDGYELVIPIEQKDLAKKDRRLELW